MANYNHDLKNSVKKTFFVVALTALIFFAFGAFSSYLFLNNSAGISSDSGRRPIRLGQKGFINPLLFYTDGTAVSPELTSLHDNIKETINYDIENGLAANIGVYVNDLKAGRWTGVNEMEKFSPASLLKVPVMVAYLKAAQNQPAILEEKLSYDGSFDNNATEDIKPLKEIEKGKSYTVDELLKFMIGYSDNNATVLLINRIGPSAISDVYSDITVPQPTSTFAEDFLGPKEYSRFFRVLYSATYLGEDMSEKAMELLNYPDLPGGILAGVPPDANVAQKFGERYILNAPTNENKELHDCGIVYHPDNPYVLCIMTKGSDLIKLEGVISGISRLVWAKAADDFKN